MINSGRPPRIQGSSPRLRSTTPTATTHSVKSPGGYHTPKVMSHQFQSSGSSGHLNFRRTATFGGMRMTTTRRGIGFSVKSGSGMSTGRTASGGRRMTTNLGNGYYTRKSSKR